QRGRVSLLRALLARPQALLLDEPFNRLDAERRADFRQWVFAEIDRLAIPAVLVTHDSQDLPPGGRYINIAAWQANSV
ncbi:TPA: sulfate ABC transporter ATP-binding protein, partial [Klebsiella aerogenes]